MSMFILEKSNGCSVDDMETSVDDFRILGDSLD